MFQRIERLAVTKRTITRLFKVAVAFVVVGGVSGTAVVVVALANGAVAFGGSQLITVNPGPFAAALVGLVLASLLTAIGTVTAILSWAAALLNTSRLQDKTWFVALLVAGLVSLGWVAMVAYALDGPDSTTSPAPSAA